METIADKINVEKFKSWLTRQRTTKDLFRWDCKTDTAWGMLCAAYEVEVASRGMTCDMPESINQYLRTIAEMITTPSTKCGILLCGNCGNGKTTSMQAFVSVTKYLDALYRQEQMTQHKFPKPLDIQVTSARRLTQVVRDEAVMKEAKTAAILCIDDMGLEPTEVLDYGNAHNPVIEVIEHRYKQQGFTFITTNLTPKQIREKYGDRVADRFNETMKCVVYTNPTFRR